MYIAPFFALTGLYWQFGLVIYWVTTNVWTLGQQHFLFRNLPIVGSASGAMRRRSDAAAVRDWLGRTGSSGQGQASPARMPPRPLAARGTAARARHGKRAALPRRVGLGPGQGRHDVGSRQTATGQDRNGAAPGDYGVPPRHGRNGR